MSNTITKNSKNSKNVKNSKVDSKGLSVVKKKQKGIMNVFIPLILLYLMIAGVMVCPEGYVLFDEHKRMILVVGLGIFAAVGIVVTLLGMEDKTVKLPFYKRMNFCDYSSATLLVSWLITSFCAVNIGISFWGDDCRCMGSIYMMLLLLMTMFLSCYFEWAKYYDVPVAIFSVLISAKVVMQYYHKDLLNWTFDGTYSHLRGYFGNPDHNALFYGLFIIILTAMFVLCSERWRKIVLGIAIVAIMMAGLAANADTYFLVVAVGVVTLVITCLVEGCYLLRLWIAGVCYLLGIICQSILFHIEGGNTVGEETIARFLYEPKTIIIIAVLLGVCFPIVFFLRKVLDNHGKKISKIVGIVVGVLVGAFALGVVILNVCKVKVNEGSFLNSLIIVDESFSRRGIIWKAVLDEYKNFSFGRKLFGAGFTNLSLFKVLDGHFGQGVTLADAHNVLIDLLFATGIVGVLGYIASFGGTLFFAIKNIGKKKELMLGVATIIGYMAGGLFNSNLILTTPLVFLIMGITQKRIREVKKVDGEL